MTAVAATGGGSSQLRASTKRAVSAWSSGVRACCLEMINTNLLRRLPPVYCCKSKMGLHGLLFFGTLHLIAFPPLIFFWILVFIVNHSRWTGLRLPCTKLAYVRRAPTTTDHRPPTNDHWPPTT